MKTTTKRVFAVAGMLALGFSAVKAQTDGALLDALVKKGVLSDQEAEDVRASEAKDYSTTSAGKLGISDFVSRVTLYGDARLRFEYIDETPQSVATRKTQGDDSLDRYRYRLRVGADYNYSDNFKAGFELESNTASDSANQSFGNGYSKASINIGLVYLQWKPVSWLTLTGGKQRNPLYTTDLTWDPDINPEGGSETASWTLPVGSSDQSFTVGFTAAQFIYADNQEYNLATTAETGTGPVTSPGGLSTATSVLATTDHSDVWQFVEQVPVQFNFSKTTFVKVVPGFDSYMDGGNTGIPGSFVNGTNGDTGFASGAQENFTGPNIADHLQIFQAPGEVDWTLKDLPMKVYWDFDLNTDGKARVQNVLLGNGRPGVTGAGVLAVQAGNKALGDNVAWLAGLQVGQNKKKGDWSIRGDFRQVGLGSIDPNENDSDWGESYLNQQGIKIQSTYNFTDFLTGSISFYDTWNYKSKLLDASSPAQGSAGSLANLPVSTTGSTSGSAAVVTTAAAGGVPKGTTLVAATAPTGTAANGYSVGSGATQNFGLVGLNTSQRVQVDLQWKF